MRSAWLWIIAISDIAWTSTLEWMTSQDFSADEVWVCVFHAIFVFIVLYLVGSMREHYVDGREARGAHDGGRDHDTPHRS